MKEADRVEINFKAILIFILCCFLGSFIGNYFSDASKLPEVMKGYFFVVIILALCFGADLMIVKHRVRTFLLLCLPMILGDFAGMSLGIFLHKGYNFNLSAIYKSSFFVIYYTVAALIVMLFWRTMLSCNMKTNRLALTTLTMLTF